MSDVNQIKVDTIKKEPCMIKFQVELSEQYVNTETDNAYKYIQTKAKLPGFRAGKVPMEQVRKHFVKEARETVITKLISDSVSQIIKDHELQPAVEPKVSELKFEFNQPMKFQLEIEMVSKFEPKDYKKIGLTKKIKPITEKDIDKIVTTLRERNAFLVDTTETIANATHYVVIDFEATIISKPDKVEKQNGVLLNLAEPFIIPGLNEKILGMKISERCEFELTIPENHGNKDLANQKVKFVVVLKQIREKKLPEVNEEFAKMLGADTVLVMNQKIKESLEEESAKQQRFDLEGQIKDHLIKRNNFMIPKTLVEERLETFIKDLHQIYIQRRGNQEEWDKNLPQLRERHHKTAEENVKLGFIFSAIAKKESVELKDEKIYQYILEHAHIKEVVDKK